MDPLRKAERYRRLETPGIASDRRERRLRGIVAPDRTDTDFGGLAVFQGLSWEPYRDGGSTTIQGDERAGHNRLTTNGAGNAGRHAAGA